jgi:hypothetical protein
LRRTRRKKRGSKALSPVISTVILMGTTIALLMVTIVFINNRLWSSVAESDFNSARQYMQTVGLQIDDVAWTMGRKETVRYASSYGSVSISQTEAINYTIYVKTQGSSTYQYFANYASHILLFNIPTSKYSLANDYYEQIYPQTTSTITFSGTSAPVARVFAREILPMTDGSFARIVVTPSVRVLSSSVNSSSSKVYYLKLYIPVLEAGSAHGSAQSVTMTGASIVTSTLSKITSINVTVTFPLTTRAQGFDSSFFRFSSLSQVINVPGGYNDAILELYGVKVETVLGVQS